MKAKEKNPKISKDLIKDLFGIIDTKIQYIEYQTEIVTSSFVDIGMLSQSSKSLGFGNGQQVEKSIMANNERILFKLNEFSATVKLLLLLRSHLDSTNAPIIFDLLSDNRFIQLTDKELILAIKPTKD